MECYTGKWSHPAFYGQGTGSFGFQIGADTSEIALLIMTEKGRDALLTTDVKLGGDISVAAGPVGAGPASLTPRPASHADAEAGKLPYGPPARYATLQLLPR